MSAEDLISAILEGDTSRVTEILQSAPRELIGRPTDEAGTTLLHVAAFGDSHIVRSLLAKGAGRDVNRQNDDGLTPLHVAAMAGNIETLHLLLSSGGDRAIRTVEGQLPVDLATEGGHAHCIEELRPLPQKLHTPPSLTPILMPSAEDSALYTTAIDLSAMYLSSDDEDPVSHPPHPVPHPPQPVPHPPHPVPHPPQPVPHPPHPVPHSPQPVPHPPHPVSHPPHPVSHPPHPVPHPPHPVPHPPHPVPHPPHPVPHPPHPVPHPPHPVPHPPHPVPHPPHPVPHPPHPVPHPPHPVSHPPHPVPHPPHPVPHPPHPVSHPPQPVPHPPHPVPYPPHPVPHSVMAPHPVMVVPKDLLSDQELGRKLVAMGTRPGPITATTRPVYMKQLARLMASGTTKSFNATPSSDVRTTSSSDVSTTSSSDARTTSSSDATTTSSSDARTTSSSDARATSSSDARITSHRTTSSSDAIPSSRSRSYKYELAQVFNGTLPLPDLSMLETEVFGLPQYSSGVKVHFNYVLLDPTCLGCLKDRTDACTAFKAFVDAIFYVGKGTNSRSLQHLRDARDHVDGKRASKKLERIHSIWREGRGVMSLSFFHNTTAGEAFTREACLIETVGLHVLTNVLKGHSEPPVSKWPPKKKRLFGIHLLRRALKVFLADTPREIFHNDL